MLIPSKFNAFGRLDKIERDVLFLMRVISRSECEQDAIEVNKQRKKENKQYFDDLRGSVLDVSV